MLTVDSLTPPSFVWSEHLKMWGGVLCSWRLTFGTTYLIVSHLPVTRERMHIVCFASRMNLYISINIYIYKYIINNK